MRLCLLRAEEWLLRLRLEVWEPLLGMVLASEFLRVWQGAEAIGVSTCTPDCLFVLVRPKAARFDSTHAFFSIEGCFARLLDSLTYGLESTSQKGGFD